MAARPNFTKVQLSGDKVTAQGESDPDTLADFVALQIFVKQEAQAGGGAAKLATGFVPQASQSWEAEFDASGLVAGPALAFGVETHSDPMTAISWAESVEIEE
jgi:hypothetical protein